MKFYKYDKSQLELAVKNNYSIAGVLKELGIRVAGGNYQTLKNAIKKFDLDTSHFSGQGHLKGKTCDYRKRKLEEILVYGKYENTYSLKRRLLHDKIKFYKCENCGLEKWLDFPIPLELHHVDGDKYNNKLDNIRILCPNCHAMTDNYRGKNKKQPCGGMADTQLLKSCAPWSMPVRVRPGLLKKNCTNCETEILNKTNNKFCSVSCASKFNKNGLKTRKVKERPSKEEVIKMIEELGFCAVGRIFGVSDNAVRKWIK